MIFYLDGEQVGTYTYNEVNGNSDYLYSVPVFQLRSLSDQNHTFVLSNGQNSLGNGEHSIVLFDSVQYTSVLLVNVRKTDTILSP